MSDSRRQSDSEWPTQPPADLLDELMKTDISDFTELDSILMTSDVFDPSAVSAEQISHLIWAIENNHKQAHSRWNGVNITSRRAHNVAVVIATMAADYGREEVMLQAIDEMKQRRPLYGRLLGKILLHRLATVEKEVDA